MRETQRVRDFAALSAAFGDLHAHLHQPQLHNRVLEDAGVSLDAALARLLIGIDRHGPVGIVEIAERSGRDHTTVSRQVAKLVELGLIERKASEEDRRISLAAATTKGARVANALRAAHMRLVMPLLDGWSARDLADATRLMRRLADDIAQVRSVVEPA